MSVEIVTLGEPLYELNQQEDGRFLPGFGGDTMNVAVAARRPVSLVRGRRNASRATAPIRLATISRRCCARSGSMSAR